ncbi:hypothetical protein [Staphylococcus aureus]
MVFFAIYCASGMVAGAVYLKIYSVCHIPPQSG